MHVHMYLNESEGLLSDCSTGVKETTRAKIAQIEYGCRMYSNLIDFSCYESDGCACDKVDGKLQIAKCLMAESSSGRHHA